MRKSFLVNSNISHRRLRNLGILFVLIALFLLVFTFGYYIFNNTDQDILHLDVKESSKNIILFWEPIIGGFLLILGIAMISRFEYIEEIDA